MRRRDLFGALLLPLAGCGFAPVYAPVAGGAPASDLGRVFVAVIPDRPGQELRQALQARLEGSGAPAAKLYTLAVSYGISTEGIGIQTDSSTSFYRFKGQASWRLLPANPAAPPLATGLATAQDSYSVIVNQYFYTDLMTAAVERRMADNLADQIVVRLAAYFRAKAKVAAR
jgi:LPS-assembly lipoprotein